ncbi:DUF3307 domain-containing protein [Croceiramulus getboli]|nr:DUF3307 domain-containing protein [Flavobacteriaceae bacterium YJPT1-3]
MDFTKLLILQLIAHLLADYTFQSAKAARSKNKKGINSKYFKWHILIVFICSFLLAFDWRFLPAAFGITLIHAIIDAAKPKVLNRGRLKKYAFFIDQVLHLLVILAVVNLYLEYQVWNPLLVGAWPLAYLVLPGLFLLCSKPSNIIIKEIFYTASVSFVDQRTDLPNAGRLIGIIERWLVLLFVIIGQFSAVGFLIAAKSILRFKDGDLLKTEYVLIGTMLSFGIAIGCGVLFTFWPEIY